jgi:ribosome-associated translation inhibitor RaiA
MQTKKEIKMLDRFEDDSAKVTAERREALRRRIKKAHIWQRQRNERQVSLDAARHRVEHGLPETYEQAVSQMQEELNALADADLDLQIDGKKPNPKTADRQKALREEIDSASEKLESDLEEANQSLKRQVREMTDFAEGLQANNPDFLRGELAGLAPESLQLQRHTARETVKWATARSKAAGKQLHDLNFQLKEPSEIYSEESRATLRGRVPRAEAELSCAQEKLAEAEAYVSTVWQRCLEE